MQHDDHAPATTTASPQPHQNVLALEISSLRSALAHYQHAADTASLQLQRRSYEANSAFERTKQLELENARLSRELAVLSSTPDTTPHPDTLNVSQLTLAHRRLSERLSLTEELLLEKTRSLEHLSRRAQNSTLFAEQCRAVLEQVQNNEEAAKQKARELERVVRSVVVEKEFVERTVEEYAELVRKLERQKKASSGVMINGSASASAILTPTRTTSDGSSPNSVMSSIDLPGPATPPSSNPSPSRNLETGKAGLNRLLSEFNATTESLHHEIARLHSQLEETKLHLNVERRANEDGHVKLASAIVELDQYKTDDKAAAKLVERYMKFSQTSIDLLQAALENQKTRSEARVATLEGENESLRHALAFAQSQTARLRDALDELTEDISRESHGRRREVALRLNVVAREERTVVELRRIARDLENAGDEGKVLESALSQIHSLVDALEAGTFDPSAPYSEDDEDDAAAGLEAEGSLARIISCQETVASFSHELQIETERRLQVEKKLADLTMGRLVVPEVRPDVVVATPSDLGVSPPESSGQVVMVSSREERIEVHPLTPAVVQVSRGSSPMEIQHPLPVVPEPTVVQVLDAEEEKGENVVKMPSQPVVPVVLVAPVPVVPPKLHETLTLEQSKPSPVPPVLSPIAIDTRGAGRATASLMSPALVTPLSAKSIIPTSPALHPLFAELAQISSRYDGPSAALRNCSAILSRVKADFAGTTLHLPSPPPATVPIFRSFLDRISDFLEDCRVELEIRAADEARQAKGFETILVLPPSPSPSSTSFAQVEDRIRRFVDGTDPAVAKAVESFDRKVGELEHDVALLKRAMYDAGLLEPLLESPSPTSRTSEWSSWTNLGSTSRSRPSSPAPTFGTVMTQPRSPTLGALAHLPPSPHTHVVEVDEKALEEIINLPFKISMPRPALHPPPSTLLEPPPPNGIHRHRSGSSSSSPIAFNPRASLSSTSLNLTPSLGQGRRASGLAGRPGGQFNMLRSVSSAVWSSAALGSSPASTPRVGLKPDLHHGSSPGRNEKDVLHPHHPTVDDSDDVE